MADVVMMAQDNPDADSNGGENMVYRLGQVVDVFEDGRLGPQTHPRFYTIRLPNCSVADLQFLLEPSLGPEEDDGEGNITRNPKRRRRDGFDWDAKIPQGVKDELTSTRETTLSANAAQVQSFVTRFFPDDA